ncbi:hypothetical protein JAAARDRAFT_37655 [Jaapia argillacea MUCL 33604]|uniref:Uncharacterized protein n=1 Tax=Jaapia argillacea MUCL 33604 TaxID=933084 RepID=A0A067PK10_9AGAM|nr:hypothetical protein JAAARDRAFT_37655 [Jaapia argillacea MUCL 33604]
MASDASTSASTPASGGGQQRQSPPQQSFLQGLPSIHILRPPPSRLPRKIDERCFIYCSQTNVGRANGHQPNCRSFCLRRVFLHQVQKVVAADPNDSEDPVAPGDPIRLEKVHLHLPLPPEGQRHLAAPGPGPTVHGRPLAPYKYLLDQRAGSFLLPRHHLRHSAKRDTPSPHEQDNQLEQQEIKCWDEGWYLWHSDNMTAAVEKVLMMNQDLVKQSEKEKKKAEKLDRYLRGEGAHVEMEERAEREAKWLQDQERKQKQPQGTTSCPPYLTTSSFSELYPLPPPFPFQTTVANTLAPTRKLLSRVYETIESGAQRKLAEKIWEKAWSKDPWILTRNVLERSWEKWKESGRGEDDPPM